MSEPVIVRPSRLAEAWELLTGTFIFVLLAALFLAVVLGLVFGVVYFVSVAWHAGAA